MQYLRLSWAPLPCWVSSFLFLHYFKSTLFLIQEGYTLQVVYHKLQLISPGYGLIQALFCKGFLRGYKWKGLYLKGIFIKKEKVLWNNLWQCWWKRILNLLVFKLQNTIISPVHSRGLLPYITYTGMCRPTGSWFWSSWFRTGYPFQRRFLERGIISRTQESSSFVSSHLKLFKDRLLLKIRFNALTSKLL